MVSIVQNGHPVLRKIAKEVPIADIGTPKINKILSRMKEALDSQEDGVAIAAPQIGESLRIFVISERAFDLPSRRDVRDVVSEKTTMPKKPSKRYGHLVFINPLLTKISRSKLWLEEGCLSVRYAYGKVRRATKASVKAWDEKAASSTRGASGLVAQIFQHEIDHLDGVLFIDKARDIKEMPPEIVGRE